MPEEKIIAMLFNVVDELNQMLPPEEHLERNLNTRLAGEGGKLDSAGLINLIVATEERAAAELGLSLVLTDDDTMSRIDQIFGSLGTLADHIESVLDEAR